MRKIIHCDADCFFAAIEVRDNPSLKGKPIAVGGRSDRRGVISTCSYEARRFGVRSAMASAHALRLCPDLLLLPHRMEAYKEASLQMHAIFEDYTDLIEPLSLDEAYLDVSDCILHQGSATLIAEEIRQRIEQTVGITVSAGVAPNKFLAKIASDWNKPNGIFVIPPSDVDQFVQQLDVAKIHGVGKVTAEKLNAQNLYTCGDLRKWSDTELQERFGKFGSRLHQLAYGIDDREVKTHRIRKSLSVEHTFAEDLADEHSCLMKIPELLEAFEKRLARLPKEYKIAKHFVKVKFNNFTTTTLEQVNPSSDFDDFHNLLIKALKRQNRPVRLLGLGVRLKHPDDNTFGNQLELFNE